MEVRKEKLKYAKLN